jgi:hypothetical protein
MGKKLEKMQINHTIERLKEIMRERKQKLREKANEILKKVGTTLVLADRHGYERDEYKGYTFEAKRQMILTGKATFNLESLKKDMMARLEENRGSLNTSNIYELHTYPGEDEVEAFRQQMRAHVALLEEAENRKLSDLIDDLYLSDAAEVKEMIAKYREEDSKALADKEWPEPPKKLILK